MSSEECRGHRHQEQADIPGLNFSNAPCPVGYDMSEGRSHEHAKPEIHPTSPNAMI